MLKNLYPIATADLGFRFKGNLSLSPLSNKNMGLALLEHGICPYEFYAAAGDLDVKISGFGYATPAILARYKYAPWTLSQTKNTLAPEIKVMSFEEVCAHFDAHPRMVQLIFNKHRSLKRSLPVSRAFNISELARFILSMSSKAARIISKLNSSPYFRGYVDNRLIGHARPSDITPKYKLLTGMLLDYTTDTITTLYSLINILLYDTMDLMTQQRLTNLKNLSRIQRPYTGIVYSRDSWSSIRSRAYISGTHRETLIKEIVSTILCVITKLDHLSFVGLQMIPNAINEIESPSGNNTLTLKHLLMYNLEAAKIAELSPELGSIAKDMYEFFFADTELSKALASKDLTPTTPMSSLSDTMSYYYNTGESSTLSGLQYHVYSNLMFHESVTIDYLFYYFNMGNGFQDMYTITREQQLAIYGSLDTIGAYYGHLGLSITVNRSGIFRYRLANFIYDLNQTTAQRPILGELSAEIWKLSLSSNLPAYAQAHMIMLNSLLSSLWDVGRADGARLLHQRSLRSIFTPNEIASHYITALESCIDSKDKQRKETFLRDLVNGIQFIPPSNNLGNGNPVINIGTTQRNVPNGSGGIYVKDYASVDTAKNFKPVTIGNRKLKPRRRT